MAYKITEDCTGCGICSDECAIEAIKEMRSAYIIDQEFCTECGSCAYVCDVGAIIEELVEV